MFRKALLTTTALVLASSAAFASGTAARTGHPVERSTKEKVREAHDNARNGHDGAAIRAGIAAFDVQAGRQNLNRLSKTSEVARKFENKIAEIRVSQMGKNENVKAFDDALAIELANLDVKSLEGNEAAIKAKLDQITLKLKGVDSETLANCEI